MARYDVVDNQKAPGGDDIRTKIRVKEDGTVGYTFDIFIKKDEVAVSPSIPLPSTPLMTLTLSEFVTRMNAYEKSIREPQLQQMSEISNNEVFTRTYRVNEYVTLSIVQHKKLQRVRPPASVRTTLRL